MKQHRYDTLFILTILLSPAAWAVSYSSDQNKPIEIIEVHSERKPQALNSVANTVSIYSADVLEKLNFKDSTALSALAPNVKITQNAAEGTPPAISIRGISLLDYNTANTAPVGMYVDDIVAGSVNNQIVNLFDTAQVEILKGPQGTLFGRNTTGGAILIYSQKPTHVREGYFTAGYANQDHLKIEGAYNQPLTENSAFRFAFSHQDYHYSTHNLDKTSPQAGLIQNNYRLLYSLKQQNWDVLVKLHTENWRGTVNPPANLGVVGDNCQISNFGSTNCTDAFGFNSGSDRFHDVKVDNHSPHLTDNAGASIHFNWDINDQLKLISLTGANRLKRYSAFNCDASTADFCNGALGVENKIYTQEFRLEYQSDSYFLSSGIFILNEQIKQDNFNDIFRDLRGSGLVPNQYTSLFLYDNNLKTKSHAAFSDFEWYVTDKTSLNIGTRYTQESLVYQSRSDVNTILANQYDDANTLTAFNCIKIESGEYENGFTADCVNWDLSGKIKDNNLSANFALKHQFLDDVLFYYRLASGYKSGGYNSGLLFTEEEAKHAEYGAEKLVANEIGVKVSFDFWQTFLQTSVFHYNYQDQQIFRNQVSAEPSTPPFQILDNVAKSKIIGLDLDIYMHPLKMWNLQFGFGYLPKAQAEYMDPTTNQSISSRLPLASKLNLSGLSQYQFRHWQVQVDFEYQSDFYFSQNENPYTRQDAFVLWNAQLAYQITPELSLKVWGKNLTDTEYSHLKFDLTGFLGMLEDFRADGRRYGVEVRYQF